MRRLRGLSAVVAVLLLLPASATAWTPSAVYDLPDDHPAVCLRPAGPGTVSVFGTAGARTSTTDLLDVERGSIKPAGSTTLGWQVECATPTDGPTTPPLIAGAVWDGNASVAGVAPAGGLPIRFAAPPAGVAADTVAVAQAPSGAAVVAWLETRTSTKPVDLRPGRLVAAIRAPGAATFGPAVAVSGWSPVATAFREPPAVGIDDSGAVVVAWTTFSRAHHLPATMVASSSPGGTFGAVQSFADTGRPSVAVSPSGRALVAVGNGELLDRDTPGGPFRSVTLGNRLDAPGDWVVALRDDGTAAVARDYARGVSVWLRSAGGAFGAEQVIVKPDDQAGFGDQSFAIISTGEPTRPSVPFEISPARLSIAIGPTGEVLATWPRGEGFGRRARSAMVSQGTVDGRMSMPSRVSNPCLDVIAVFPLLLRDGRLGVVWSDARNGRLRSGQTTAPAGRVHLSVPGTAPAVVPTPRTRARYAGPYGVRAGQDVPIRVSCREAPCIVRASTPDMALEGWLPERWTADQQVIAAGANATLMVQPYGPADRPRLRPRRHPIEVVTCTEAGAVVSRATLHPTLHQLRPRPLPRIVRAHARRDGSRVTLTWRTDRPARGVIFSAWARPHAFATPVSGRGRTTFRTTLDDVPSRASRVELVVSSREGLSRRLKVAIAVRGR